MPLPDIPTTEEIYNRIINDIETKLNQTTPLLPKAFNVVLALSVAGAFTILYKIFQWGVKQIFTITQDEDSLSLKGEQYGIAKKTAQAAVLTATFTGVNGTLIDQGKQFRGNSNGLLYSLDAATQIITGGSITATVNCLTLGDTGNLVNDSIITILEPIADLDNQATISATVTEGEEAETIDAYRPRIQEREQRPPQGGSLSDYILWGNEVEGITRTFAWGHREILDLTPGYVWVFPLQDDDSVTRIPSQAKLDEVLAYINDPSRAPLQVVRIYVLAMTEVTFNVTVTNLEPDTTEIRERFAENIATYLLEREPEQFIDTLDPKNVISRAGVEAIYIDSGAQSVTLTIDAGAGTIEDYTLEYNELAKLGTIT